jgi:branched-chain amino acid transport system substrate-binding protein
MASQFFKSLWLPLAACLLVSACDGNQTSEGGDKPAAPGDAIKIGVAAPLTGPNAKPGQDILNGVKLAVEEKNAKGGLMGKPIELLEGDDRSDPREGIVVANKLVNSGVVGVIGHYNSGVSIPASEEVYNPSKVVNISPGSTNPKYTERGLKWVFRTIGRDDQQGKVGADFAIAKGLKNVAIIHNKGAYGQGLAEEFKKNLEAQGGKTLIFDGISKDDKDFSAILTKIKNLNPQMIFYGGEYQDGSLFSRQSKQGGIKAPIMGGDALYDKDYIKLTGQEYATGNYVTFSTGNQSDTFRKNYTAKFGEVGPYSAYAYDAANILLASIEKSGGADPEKIRDTVAATQDFPGVTGAISFNPKGDLTRAGFAVWEVGPKGDFTIVDQKVPVSSKKVP